jgi:hypothetical protein
MNIGKFAFVRYANEYENEREMIRECCNERGLLKGVVVNPHIFLKCSSRGSDEIFVGHRALRALTNPIYEFTQE